MLEVEDEVDQLDIEFDDVDDDEIDEIITVDVMQLITDDEVEHDKPVDTNE